MIVIWRFRINTPEYYGKITCICCDAGKSGEYRYVFLELSYIEFFLRMPKQMNKMIFYSYMNKKSF